MKKVINCAHRGAMAYAPQNTIKAFKLAVEMGADMVELDAHRTADGIVIVNHDTRFNKTTPKAGKITGLKYCEVEKLKFEGQNIPKLEEVIQLCKESNIGIDIECKQGSAIEKVVDLVKKYDFIDQTLITQFNPYVLKKSRSLEPAIETGFLTLPVLYPRKFKRASNIGATAIVPNIKQVNKRFMKKAERNNLKVIVWTVNEENDMKKLIDLGVDGIITNKPDLLAKIKSRMGVS